MDMDAVYGIRGNEIFVQYEGYEQGGREIGVSLLSSSMDAEVYFWSKAGWFTETRIFDRVLTEGHGTLPVEEVIKMANNQYAEPEPEDQPEFPSATGTGLKVIRNNPGKGLGGLPMRHRVCMLSRPFA